MSVTEKKKRAYASNTLLYTVFVIGAVVVVNLIGTRVFGRADLTEAKVYTLSQPSKDLVKALPDYLKMKLFISKELPPELKSASRYVRDLIDEYANASKGKLQWEAIDPAGDKAKEEEANRCQVQKLQIQVLRSQKFEMGSYYLGLCLQYGEKVEAIPQVAQQEGLEYQITSLIKKLTTKKKKIAFTTGHGELDQNQGFSMLRQDLEQEYDLASVNPSQAEIGTDVDALVVGGPKQPLDDKAQREIDKFAMTGKGVVFLIDGMHFSSPQGGGFEQFQMKMAQPVDSGLGTLLAAYGFKINQDFVFDPGAAMPGPMDAGGRKMLVNAPFFVGVQADPKNDLSILAGIKGVIFPFGSSVETTGPLSGGAAPQGGKLWKLAVSSPESFKHTGFLVLQPNMKIEEPKERGASAFGYAYQGKLKSAFHAEAAPMQSADGTAPPASESARPVRLVVIGDSDFASDEYVQLARFLPFYSLGAQLLFNSIAWTVEDEALTPLRTKRVAARPIKVASEGAAQALQWGNVLGLPLAFCVFGIVRWRVRRAARLGQKL